MQDKQGLEADQSHPLLCDRIAQHIAAQPQGRIPFTEFMNLALYDPEYGYYATNRVNIGKEGDFYTAPHLGSDFGELLAEQFAEMWRLLGFPQPFTLVEMGAGQGLLVRDVLRYLHRHHDACFDALEYIVVEASPALRQLQQQQMSNLLEFDRLHWRTWDEIPLDSVVGCFFSNELVDAFPVHRIILKDGALQEIFVVKSEKAEEGVFGEAIAPLSTPEVETYLQLSGISLTTPPYPDGYSTEVNLASLDWLTTVAQRLRQGYVLTIDYGYPAQRFYLPSRRAGTLQCYFQHHHHDNPFIHVGSQDITAHVNFTALEKQGEKCGLESLGFTQQGLFLMALGMGDRIAELSNRSFSESFTLSDLLARREALHGLIDPMGLGNFGVLLQGKGLQEEQRKLRGFQIP
ncbi:MULTISPECIES: class I SAM-dependent methyltransferase [unclassified Leptolyngbya]|uniref:class I SAM-dependent methyltransferase n=1 Tax=unclassified Leptolyngbya TaxID=2650499 RepID=UPI00168418A3|nr:MULTISPECIES: class I SAM-dependent methyltransferase [unclassified Leptolyngbya]MBD1910616.1 class I SAM-dependent methyltransferase [Leptolyngbya sp. FACHB-8]MBD2154556.1 class I SAM-dependent methyltransferase [Leptolyngbya sp. FACHB-16]